MTIQIVFFDMGGTIETFWYTRELRLRATPELQKMLLEAGIDLGLTDEQLYEVITNGLNRYHRWRQQCWEELPTQRIWREFVLTGYPIDFDALDAITEDLMLYIETHYYHRTMRPEIPAVLDAIRQMGLKIGLISNVTSHGQVPTNLKKYNLWHYFYPIVLSSEYGRRKPDPAIFHFAARLANVPTSQCVYVGDRISRDIVGARKAGYRLAVQIKHDFDHGEHDVGATPHAVIRDMTELLDLLRAELNRSDTTTSAESLRQHPIRALLFDAGDILYFRPQRGRRLDAFLNELGNVPVDDSLLPAKYDLSHQAFQGKIDQDQYRESILRLYGVTQQDHIERGKRILDEEDNDVHFFEGVRDSLIALKQMGFLLAVVTDTASPLHVKIRWLERGGFGHVWDAIISSKDLGIRKPDPQIYQAALRQLGLQPSQAVFVGHNATELEGAHAVGMKTIAFNYESNARADAYIKRFADLLELPLLNQIEIAPS